MELLAIALSQEAHVIVRPTERAHDSLKATNIRYPIVEHSREARRRWSFILGPPHFVTANSAQIMASVKRSSAYDRAFRSVSPVKVDIDALRGAGASQECAELLHATIGLHAALGGKLRVREGHRD